jgi:signal transduction histidine kinase
MGLSDTFHAEGVRRLYDVMRRVNSPTDPAEVLEEVANGVVEALGYGVAAIARPEGDEFVTTAVAGLDDIREQLVGRRTPVRRILEEFSQADQWGILRYVPHDRIPAETLESLWIPDFEVRDEPDAWHPLDALYAPLYSAEGELLGNMSVDLPPGMRVPNQQQRELLEMFVVQAGLAIANAQQREKLAEQVRLGQALKQVALAGSVGDLDRVLAEAAAAVARGLDGSQVYLRCFPGAGDDTVEHAAGYPAANPGHRGGTKVPGLRRDLVQLAAQRGPGPVVLRAGDTACAELPDSAADLQALMASRGWSHLAVAPLGLGMEVLGYLVVMRTEDQWAFSEAELVAVHEASRELGRLVQDARVRDTERRLVAELQELDRYKGELIATISHELRTPLTSIVGHAELLEESETHASSVAAITRNAARLQLLVENLLNYARVQDNRERVRRPVDLAELCAVSVEMLGIVAEAADVRLTAAACDGPVHVLGDPEELRVVVDNICGNAVKYTRPGGSVVVEARVRDGYGEVAVTDTGLGISAGDLTRLFSAFDRSTNPDALTIPGTGLGLAISRRIAELHSGEIVVDSELGRGSTFTVRVPLASAQGSSA